MSEDFIKLGIYQKLGIVKRNVPLKGSEPDKKQQWTEKMV
jgi:hypothetical protein